MDNFTPTTPEQDAKINSKADDSVLLDQIVQDKNSAIEYQKPRQGPWTENYNLSRDRVVNNPLVQRHPVNVPLMKEQELAWLGKIDDMPSIYFDCISDDPELAQKKELLINEYWSKESDRLNIPILDFVGKRVVFHTGRTHAKIGLVNGKFMLWITDAFDVVVDPKTNPMDIQTAMHIHNLHIYKTLKEILADPTISKEAKGRLNSHLATNKGLFSTSDTVDQIKAKLERLKALNITNYDKIIGTDLIIDCTETVRKIWNPKTNKYELFVILQAYDTVILKKRTMQEALGIDRFNYASWCYNPDTELYWELGPGDIARNPNKMSNLFLSQFFENRSLANNQMNFFDDTFEGFHPEAFTARQFGFYGVPGKPSDIIMPIKVEPFDNAIQADLEYIRAMASRGMITTDIDKGMSSPGNQTKGEIEILASRSQRQVNNLQKFYNRFWQEIANFWLDLAINKATILDKTLLTKRGNNGQLYSHNLKVKDIKNDKGYVVRAVQMAQKDEQTRDTINKLSVLRNQFMDNPVAMNIIKEKMLTELNIFTPDEIRQIKATLKNAPAMPINQTLSTLGQANAMAGGNPNA